MESMDIDQLASHIRGGVGICSAIKICDYVNTYPVRREGKIYYARGEYWTTLVGPELALALSRGSIADIGLTQLYTMGYPFKHWAEQWLAIRSKAKHEDRPISFIYAKMILNSLSGKWAQSGMRWIDRPEAPRIKDWGLYHTVDIDNGETHTYRFIAGHPQEQVDGGRSQHYFPILSAYICSYGRMFMDGIKRQMPEKSYLYKATDSLLVTEEGYGWLSRNGYLNQSTYGHLKLQDRGDWGEIHGPNHYQIEDRMTQAGIVDIAYQCEDGTWRAAMRDSIDSTLSRDPTRRIVTRHVDLGWITHSPHHNYDADGWIIPPTFTPRLPEIEEALINKD